MWNTQYSSRKWPMLPALLLKGDLNSMHKDEGRLCLGCNCSLFLGSERDGWDPETELRGATMVIDGLSAHALGTMGTGLEDRTRVFTERLDKILSAFKELFESGSGYVSPPVI